VEAGYVAIHPEDHNLQSQIEHYLAAERIIFSEGSAIHLIDILPPLRAEVAVITRRDRRLGEQSLIDKCAQLYFVDGLFLGAPKSSGAGRARGLAWLDVGRCLEALASWGFIDAAPAGDLFNEPDILTDDLISYIRANPPRPELEDASDEVVLREGLAYLMRGMRSVIRERLAATPPLTVPGHNELAGEREQRAAHREAERAQRTAERNKRLMERERRLAERAALGRSPGRPQQHAKPELA